MHVHTSIHNHDCIYTQMRAAHDRVFWCFCKHVYAYVYVYVYMHIHVCIHIIYCVFVWIVWIHSKFMMKINARVGVCMHLCLMLLAPFPPLALACVLSRTCVLSCSVNTFMWECMCVYVESEPIISQKHQVVLRYPRVLWFLPVLRIHKLTSTNHFTWFLSGNLVVQV